jgi:hypothetical protein
MYNAACVRGGKISANNGPKRVMIENRRGRRLFHSIFNSEGVSFVLSDPNTFEQKFEEVQLSYFIFVIGFKYYI